MPFTRLQELGGLAASIDTAMARNDDIGMDMLRDLLPELRETIDAVNTALREVDGLLFEGLRDEAVTLNDPEFPALAARLHLEDRAAWPAVQAFFTVEGINLPPKIDFDTLTSMESAHAELEELRRPLDQLRRLNLERAPLQSRLAQLRKLRDIDPTKPVWAQAIAAHEEARVGQLHEEVRQAVGARNPAAIAALHAELVDPEWGIPVPRDLIRNTRGADVWMRMREAVRQAEDAAAALEAGHAELADAPPSPDLLFRQRQSRQAWLEAEATMQECMAALADCPQIAVIVREESLERRLLDQAPRVQQAMQWLAVEDAREATILQHQQVCGQLEYLVDHPPKQQGDEVTWLAGVGRLESDLVHCCQAEPSLGYPDLLRERVRSATAEVKGREARRRRFFVMTVAAGVLAAAGVVWGLWSWRAAVGRHAQVLADLRSMREEAEHGAYDALPEQAEAIVAEYAGDRPIGSEGAKLEKAVARERERRGSFSMALGHFEAALQKARSALEERQSKQDSRLEPWDDSVTEAAEAWREARRVGGEPAKREPPASGELSPDKRPRAAQDVLATEETRLEEAKGTQLDLEKLYANAAIEEFRRQRTVIEDAIPKSDAADRTEVASKLLKDLESLIKRGKEPKADRIDRLLGDPLRKSRVPYVESEAATLLGESLKRLIKNASGS